MTSFNIISSNKICMLLCASSSTNKSGQGRIFTVDNRSFSNLINKIRVYVIYAWVIWNSCGGRISYDTDCHVRCIWLATVSLILSRTECFVISYCTVPWTIPPTYAQQCYVTASYRIHFVQRDLRQTFNGRGSIDLLAKWVMYNTRRNYGMCF